jgi:uncharacterized protein
MTDLELHTQRTPLCDTHEHLGTEADWIGGQGDVLADLFHNYAPADLLTAGASEDAVARLSEPLPVGERFAGIQEAWEATRFTGYGEAVRVLAREVYGLDELSAEGLERAQTILTGLRQPGERLRLLRDKANLDHVQIDNFCWKCAPEGAEPGFFLYDLNWQGFCSGGIHSGDLPGEVGIEVQDLAGLRRAQEALFAKYGRLAIAVKAQHAYGRTLDWRERSDDDAARALRTILDEGDRAPQEARLCLGDWSWAHGIELAIQYNLPFKIHTGYYAGNWNMVVDRIQTGQLYRLLQKYRSARFVLMHIAYPYSDELVAMAKHFPNVWVDLCWAWSIDPYSSTDFVRRFLHTVPINKLFAFGGDTGAPTSALAYAWQARKGLTRALSAEVATGELTEAAAISIATRLMLSNAYACFDVSGTRSRLVKEKQHAERNAAEEHDNRDARTCHRQSIPVA